MGYAGPGDELDAVAVKRPFELLADFLVLIGHEMRQQLDDGDLGSVHAVNVGEFDADGAAANNGNRVRHVLRDDALPAGYDALTVHRKGRDAARSRSGGDDDVAGGNPRSLTVRPNHLDRVRTDNASSTGNAVDAVLAEQEVDAAGHAVDYLAAALHRDAVVSPEIVELEAELVGTVDVGDDLSILQERLGGNAAPIKADTAQRFSLDDAGLQSQLTGPYAGDIAAGAAANYCYVILRDGRHQSVRKGGLFERNMPRNWLAPLPRGLRADCGIIAAAGGCGKVEPWETSSAPGTSRGREFRERSGRDSLAGGGFRMVVPGVRSPVPRPCRGGDDPYPAWGP